MQSKSIPLQLESFGLDWIRLNTHKRIFFFFVTSFYYRSKSTVSFPLTGLDVGDYKLNMGDSGRDGICCGSSGDGKFWITDDTRNAVVYENNGQFGKYIQITVEVKDNGEVVSKGETTDYKNSWERAEVVPNYPQVVDQVWPGPLPDQPKSIFVNVKFDKYPEETSWELSKASGSAWTSIKKFSGKTDGVRSDELSVQLNDLEASWYKLVFTDSGKDGICCTYRRGWVAVTGYILATRRSGLVWGNNGEFGAEVFVYFQMNSAGMVNRLSMDAPTIA